jgi:hypothetical protein
MKFKVGDKVRFMAEKGGGVIVRFSGKDTVYVEIEDGFEIPVKESEILLAESNSSVIKREESHTKEIKENVVPDRSSDYISKPRASRILPQSQPVKLSLAFILRNPDNPGGSEIDVFLINDSLYSLQFVLNYEQQSITYFHSGSILEPEIQWHAGAYTQSELSKINAFHVQGSYFSEGKYIPLSTVDSKVPIQDIQFYKQKFYKESDYFDQKAVIFTLFSWKAGSDKENTSKQSDSTSTENKGLLISKSGAREIDLHIEALTDDHKLLSPAEMLNIQLSRFRDSMSKAQNERWKQLIFIHGVGDGRLKFELRKIIDSQFPDARYQDASFLEYGYGATLVFMDLNLATK